MKDIMSADTYGIDHNAGETNLVREGKDFDTVIDTEELIVDAGKTAGKQGLDSAILNSDKDTALYG